MSFDNLFWGSQDVPNHSQWKIKAESLLADRDVWHITADKKFPLGAIADARDGKRWRYQKCGSSGLSKAMINQVAVETSNWTYTAQTDTPGIPTKGDKIVTVVMDSTAAKDAFVDGLLLCPDGTGQGEMYTIKTNKAGIANTVGPSGYDIQLEIADTGGIRTTLVAASDLSLILNKYSGAIVFPNDPTGPCIGVNNVAVTADYYFWGQTRGPCIILTAASTDTIVIGDAVGAGAVTAGAMSLLDMAAEGDTFIGYCMKAPVTASDYGVVDLQIE